MSKRAALIALWLTALVSGLYIASPWSTPEPRWPDWLLMVLGLFCVFAWLGADQTEHGHRRSPWMNIGIVLLALVFVPVYLLRSRPKGRRLRALGGFLAVAVAWIGSYVAGGALGLALFPEPA